MPRTETWTTRRLLQWTTQRFQQQGIDSPRIAAEMLLAHVLECDRLRLYMQADRPASALEKAAFRDLVERALKQEPVDYLVGQAPFFSMTLAVSPAVLVPRPSTETLVEHILQHARVTPGFHAPRILDLGTGSGAIAIALAKHLPEATVIATDLSEDALQLAGQNAKTLGVADRITFRQGHLLEPVVGERFHYLASNPPYIPDHEWDDVPANVKDHEPTSALRAGPDGLDLIRPLIAGVADHLHQPGQFVLEHAACHAEVLPQMIDDAPGLTQPRILADHEHLPRILVADRA